MSKNVYLINDQHHLTGSYRVMPNDYVPDPTIPETDVPQPNESNKVYFDFETKSWIEEPTKPAQPVEATAQDKINAQILATLAADKTAQSKFNAQVLLQLASKTTKEVQA
ncbi:hypothetical protein [Furfurilactobacillus rossiae]|uniref:Uncharacterized protein n=1 Tax=Furfurilactobacillus rossiae DSM 15814 TaxID=1114972 RepID=A0A0R1RIJ6_9LACO|nr:hypothetical protein [Furfurilactobacillus rossiae]KRL56687.1 hypothetical protein FD35_GL001786 [Furfurilactobacillus rossiae DSM 15814]QFR66412.1 hypothetical protein LR814_04595 [Furfurilactobacillus rossiae]QLE61868.1 hypothetical protein LROSRS0_1823 [Furfurilactobacillus rossiae]